MGRSVRDFSGGGILSAPARDLLERSTAEPGVPLTVTDLNGSVDPAALAALDQPGAMEAGGRGMAPYRRVRAS
jgi:hypothetical protein